MAQRAVRECKLVTWINNRKAPLGTHQALAVAECHSGRAVLILQESNIVTVIYHVMTPLQPFFAPILHCKMF